MKLSKTAAERVKRFGAQIVLFVKENPSEHLSGEEWCFVLHDEEFAEKTKVRLIAALESMRIDTVEMCCAAVLDECPECGGSGTISAGVECRHCTATRAAIREATGVTK